MLVKFNWDVPAASVFLACNGNNYNTSNLCRKLSVASQLQVSTFFLFKFLSGLPAIAGLAADFPSPKQVHSLPGMAGLWSLFWRARGMRWECRGRPRPACSQRSHCFRLPTRYSAEWQRDTCWPPACAWPSAATASLPTGSATPGKPPVLSKPTSLWLEWGW